MFDESSIGNVEDDLLEDEDYKASQAACELKEESEEPNTKQKPRYAPVVKLEKKTTNTKKGTSKGEKNTPKKQDTLKLKKKRKQLLCQRRNKIHPTLTLTTMLIPWLVPILMLEMVRMMSWDIHH